MKIENDQINSYENAEIGGECEFWWKKMQSQTYKFSNENRKQGHVITKTWFLGKKKEEEKNTETWICTLLLLDKSVDIFSLKKWKRKIELPRLDTSYLHFYHTLSTKESTKGTKIRKSTMWLWRLDSNSVTCIFLGK